MKTQLLQTRLLKWWYTLVILLFVVGNTLAQTNLTEKIPVAPEIKVGKLSNGLTYYIRKNTRPENKVELRLVVNAGSIQEDDDQQGLAHFTEHMSFNGTKNFEKNELVSFLQSIGVEFGADLNAYTSFDETVYILPIPTANPEHLEKGFQVLEDWASNVTLEDEEIDKERGVVLEESRLGKGADDRMFRKVYPKIFEDSKYAERLPIGKDEILKDFKYDVLKRFYRDWYRPNLMAVIVVGDIEPAEAEKKIKAHFEKLKNPTNERERTYAKLFPRKDSEGMVVTDPEATNHILQIFYSYKEAEEEVTLADYRELLIEHLFVSMLSQRMQELTQKSNPPFVYGSSYIGGWARGYESFNSYAYVSKAGVEDAVKALIQENERARKFGFTASELDRTKKNMMKNIERAYNEREKTESEQFADEYIRNFLEKEPIPGIANEYKYYQEFLPGITLEEVNQYAAKTIPADDAHKLVVLTGPEKADFKIPTNEELLAMANNAAKEEITPYEEKEVASSLMEKPPAAGKITSEKVIKELSVTELALSNGVKVLLKPTDFKNDQVVMSATRFGGQYLFDVKDRHNAEFASTIVAQMGVGDFSPVDLRKVLAGKTVSVSPRLGTTTETIGGQSSASDVEAMLQLTHLYFTKPRIDKELFNSFVTKQQALYQNMLSNPQYTFQDSILSIMYQKHPWAPQLPKAEKFGQINVDRVLDIYKQRFGDAAGFTFVIVGSFDINAIKPMIATYLGSLPSSSNIVSRTKDVGLRPVKGVVKKEVKKGTEPKSYIRMFFNGEAPYSEAEQLKVQALIEVLNIKLIETLREDLSGIYGGALFGGLNKHPYNNYSIGVALPCGPENVDKLIEATLAEIEKVKTKGPEEADLNKVKETWKTQYKENIKDNNFWASALIRSVENETPVQVLDYEKRIEALTTKDLKEVANKYFDMKNYVQVVLYPEK